MSVSQIPAPPAQLNKGAFFSTSGSWTVPSNVMFAYVVVRGGDGENASIPAAGTSNGTIATTNGATGGTSSVLSISAAGGVGGTRHHATGGNGYSVGSGNGPVNGTTVAAIVATTPGNSETVTVGTGTGAYVSIMWSEA